MLDKLVVSKNSTKENRRIGNFLLTSSLAMVSVLTVGLVYSLFTHNLAMGTEDLVMSELVAPVIETEAKPEPPKEEIKPEKRKSSVSESKVIKRKTNTLRTNESPTIVPDKISVKPSNVKARPNAPFVIDDVDTPTSDISSGAKNSRNTDSSIIGTPNTNKPTPVGKVIKKPEIEKPPLLKKETVKKEEVKKIKRTISGGVVNGKAIRLVQPTYSAAAKTMNIRGKVTVQVLIDENGNVVKATAVKGHPLLKQSAVRAARASKFSPTYLSKQKVKVSGVIVYNFIG